MDKNEYKNFDGSGNQDCTKSDTETSPENWDYPELLPDKQPKEKHPEKGIIFIIIAVVAATAVALLSFIIKNSPDKTGAMGSDGFSEAYNQNGDNINGKHPEVNMHRIASASTIAGEVLPASNADSSRSFEAGKAVDGNPESCWCVSMSEYTAAGAKMRIDLASYSRVRGIRIINGNLYSPADDIYLKNGQLEKFTLSFSDGTVKTFTAPYNQDASDKYIYFDFPYAVDTDYIILTVDSYYPGNKFTSNVCIGEIGVYG